MSRLSQDLINGIVECWVAVVELITESAFLFIDILSRGSDPFSPHHYNYFVYPPVLSGWWQTSFCVSLRWRRLWACWETSIYVILKVFQSPTLQMDISSIVVRIKSKSNESFTLVLKTTTIKSCFQLSLSPPSSQLETSLLYHTTHDTLLETGDLESWDLERVGLWSRAWPLSLLHHLRRTAMTVRARIGSSSSTSSTVRTHYYQNSETNLRSAIRVEDGVVTVLAVACDHDSSSILSREQLLSIQGYSWVCCVAGATSWLVGDVQLPAVLVAPAVDCRMIVTCAAVGLSAATWHVHPRYWSTVV